MSSKVMVFVAAAMLYFTFERRGRSSRRFFIVNILFFGIVFVLALASVTHVTL